MATYEERNNAISYLACTNNFTEKADIAFKSAVEAFDRIKSESSLMNKSTMAMNIAYLTLYLEAIQLHYNIPASSVDGWIDAFVRDENRKADGGV